MAKGRKACPEPRGTEPCCSPLPSTADPAPGGRSMLPRRLWVGVLDWTPHGLDTTCCFWNWNAMSLRAKNHPCCLKCRHLCFPVLKVFYKDELTKTSRSDEMLVTWLVTSTNNHCSYILWFHVYGSFYNFESTKSSWGGLTPTSSYIRCFLGCKLG